MAGVFVATSVIQALPGVAILAAAYFVTSMDLLVSISAFLTGAAFLLSALALVLALRLLPRSAPDRVPGTAIAIGIAAVLVMTPLSTGSYMLATMTIASRHGSEGLARWMMGNQWTQVAATGAHTLFLI